MALDTALMVRASGSALLAVAGVVALVLARRDRGAITLGIFLVAWGTRLAGNNLLSGNAAAGVYWGPIVTALAWVGCASFIGLVLWWPGPLRREERRGAIAVLALAAVLALLRIALQRPADWEAYARGLLVPMDAGVGVVYWGTTALLEAAEIALVLMLPLRYLASRPEDGDLRRRVAWASVIVLNPWGHGDNVIVPGRFLLWDSFLDPPITIATFTAAALFLLATRQQDGHPARFAAHGILAMMLGSLCVQAWYGGTPAQNAIVGIQRSAVAFLLVLAMMRFRLLGRDVQFRTARRGTLAAGALAALFIVAQVAQNYLSAEYGLLTGGLVAGALLFAAQPLQRGFERLVERPVAGTAPAARAGAPDAREAAYRAAARKYLRDGRLARDEERELAHLAGELGLHAGRAMEIRHEVEDALTRP